MNLTKLIFTLLTITALVLVPSVGSAATFTFNVTDGDWNTPGNWAEPFGPPKAGDNAIIPSGKTCRVKTANQAADDVDVQSGGTLVIESKSLTVSSGTTLTVNGTGRLELNNTGGGAGKLLWLSGNLTIDGSGKIDAGDGVITNSGSTTGNLSIGTSGATGPSVAGELTIDPAGTLFNYGLLLVDDSADTMVLGKLSSAGPLRILRGSGEMTVTAGLIKIGRIAMANGSDAGPAWNGTITVDGANATLNVTEYVTPSETQLGQGCVLLDGGGTIDLDTIWVSQGGFSFTNGTFEISASAAAVFEGDCP